MIATPGEDSRGGLAPAKYHSSVLLCLAVLAAAYTMYFAATLLVPIVASLLLYFLLSPIVARLASFGLNRAIASIVVVLALIAMLTGALYQLSEPGARWLRDAPNSVAEFRDKLRPRPGPLADVRNASEAVEDAVAEITGSEDGSEDAAPEVEIREPDTLESVLARLPAVAASSLVTCVLTLFSLIYGDRFLRRLVALGGTFAARKRIVVILRQVERDIARYLGTITLVNIGLGVVVGLAMHGLGLPNPVLWGTVACLLNFAPYVGAALTATTLLLAGVATFDSLNAMLAPAGAFLIITIIEGQMVTPMLLGRRLELNPMIVFLSVVVLGWLWDLVGALIAVPLVASIRIVLSNTPRLRGVGNLLAR
jgi:predicted PurR-regulated permease PerM